MRLSSGTPWFAVTTGLALLAGCGAGDPLASDPAAAATPAARPDAQPTLTKPPAAGALDPPAASSDRPYGFAVADGRITAVDGASMRLEDERRSTVSWSERTTFSELVDAARTDLAVGKCARVRPARISGAMSGGEEEPRDLNLRAAAVTLSDAVDGLCAPGTPGMLPGGAGEPRTEAARPDGGPHYWFEWRGPRRLGPVPGPGGIVTAVEGDAFTIEMRRPGRDVGPSGHGREPITHRVTTDAETTWQRMAGVDSSAVQVGKCAAATGRPTDPRTFVADSITLRPAKNDRCAPEGARSTPGPRSVPGPGPGSFEPRDFRPLPRPEERQRPEPRRRPDDRRPEREHRPEPATGGSGAGGGGGAAGTRTR